MNETTNIFTEDMTGSTILFKQRLNKIREDIHESNNKNIYNYPNFLDDVGRNEVRECSE